MADIGYRLEIFRRKMQWSSTNTGESENKQPKCGEWSLKAFIININFSYEPNFRIPLMYDEQLTTELIELISKF